MSNIFYFYLLITGLSKICIYMSLFLLGNVCFELKKLKDMIVLVIDSIS